MSPCAKAILNHLQHGPETILGLSQQTFFSDSRVRCMVTQLKRAGLIEAPPNQPRHEPYRWVITEAGLRVCAELVR